MTNQPVPQPLHPSSVYTRMVQGAAIALTLIALFLLGVHNPKPEWGKLWMVRPLIIVPLAGAMGGVLYYLMDYLRYQGGWKKAAAVVLSLLGYLVVLWLGTVLGLDGTLWN